MNKKKKQDTTLSESADFTVKSRIDTDPLGSWTGTPDDQNEKPIQDVDDL